LRVYEGSALLRRDEEESNDFHGRKGLRCLIWEKVIIEGHLDSPRLFVEVYPQDFKCPEHLNISFTVVTQKGTVVGGRFIGS
jgi:hypothetical protein